MNGRHWIFLSLGGCLRLPREWRPELKTERIFCLRTLTLTCPCCMAKDVKLSCVFRKRSSNSLLADSPAAFATCQDVGIWPRGTPTRRMLWLFGDCLAPLSRYPLSWIRTQCVSAARRALWFRTSEQTRSGNVSEKVRGWWSIRQSHVPRTTLQRCESVNFGPRNCTSPISIGWSQIDPERADNSYKFQGKPETPE